MNAHAPPGAQRSVLRRFIGALLVLLIAAATFWAGRVTVRPAESHEQVPVSQIDVEVVEQELGRVLTLTTTVTRPNTAVASNSLTGVVTSVPSPENSEFDQGDVVYTVGATPVILVEGNMPFWRDLSAGARGPDVAQVQRMLIDAGSDLHADGNWGSSTTAAVRAWQQQSGHPVTGTFNLGELIATPVVPVPLTIDHQVARAGALLAGGEEIVSIAAGDPSFAMQVTQSQADMIPTGTHVSIAAERTRWPGVIGETRVTEDGFLELLVTAPDGGIVCGSECDILPAADTTHLLTDVVIVPPVTGPVVPLAALVTRPDGTISVDVVLEDSQVETRPVSVLTVADGLAVVEGVEAGERVRALGEEHSETGAGTEPVPEPDPADDPAPDPASENPGTPGEGYDEASPS